MIEKHLLKLKEFGNIEKEFIGSNSLNWAISVKEGSVIKEFDQIDPSLNRCFNRYELFEYCSNENISNVNVAIAILSWGGMRRDHARLLFHNFLELDSKINKLRQGIYKSRKEAYEDFFNSRIKKKDTRFRNWIFYQIDLLFKSKFEWIYYGSMGWEISKLIGG